MITAFPLEQAPGSRPGAEPIGCWVTLSDLVPLPGSFAVWQLAGSRARRQGAFFSFGARVAGPGPRFCSAPFSHSAPAPTPNKVLCFAHFSQHSPLSSPQHLSVSRLAFRVQDSPEGPPTQRSKSETAHSDWGLQPGRRRDCILPSRPDETRRMERLNHLPHCTLEEMCR